MNKHSRALLLGMLLGDGCLKTKHHIQKNGNKSIYYEYVICHSIKQEEYLIYKRDLFHSLMGGKFPKICYETVKLKNNKKYEACRFSRCHKLFRILHKYLYSNNNKKYFTKKTLNYLNPQSLALWYMDDGGLSKNKWKDKISSCSSKLFTYCTEQEANEILEYFKNVWNINPRKKEYTKKGQWNIVFSVEETSKFEKLISPYIIPSMQYKLPSYWIPRVLDPIMGEEIV